MSPLEINRVMVGSSPLLEEDGKTKRSCMGAIKKHDTVFKCAMSLEREMVNSDRGIWCLCARLQSRYNTALPLKPNWEMTCLAECWLKNIFTKWRFSSGNERTSVSFPWGHLFFNASHLGFCGGSRSYSVEDCSKQIEYHGLNYEFCVVVLPAVISQR